MIKNINKIIIFLFCLSVLSILVYSPYEMVVTGRSDGYSLNKNNTPSIPDRYCYIWDLVGDTGNYNYGKITASIGNPNYIKITHKFITITFFYICLYMLLNNVPKIIERAGKVKERN